MLLDTTNLLLSVLLLFPLLPRGGNLGIQALSDEPVFGFELLRDEDVVVNQAEASGLATSELCPEPVQEDALRILDLVHFCHFFFDLRFWHTGSSLMENIHDLATEDTRE